ncbi:4-alpha-glucanotransferase [Ruania halotolerans]|uniref:4-alpha-glucanotransferase n=1 Tax=Ruania halotolerans TaxID=2897773 RepID=UPI001E5D8532|nr:4-alpha-glucanotransferase [Ruania halotolerans]UFU05308.1 4-alpha-glucanotransferase [Ruania halotolerans]
MTEQSNDALSSDLRKLAAAHGVATHFWDFHGARREVAASTVRAVLAAMGVPADTPEEVRASRREATLAPWRRTLPSCVVMCAGQTSSVAVHVPDGAAVRVWLELDGGGSRPLVQLDTWVEPRDVDGSRIGRATFELPDDLPLGWHEIVAEVGGTGPAPGGPARAPLAVTPATLPRPELRADLGGRAWGLMAQLYSVRSARSWGIGDFADLAELAGLAGEVGADFLLINPVHAAEPSPPLTPSPYLPATRRFVNPLYIRPEEILEAGYLPNAQRTLMEWGAESVQQMNSSSGPLDRDAVWQEKKSALETIFASGRSRSRQRELDRFRAEHGQGLEDFALWCAVTEAYDEESWPLTDDATAASLTALRRTLADRVNFHCWLQWVADEQLARAARIARESGMRIGVMQDLAVGVHPEGADAWSMRHVFARGMSVGAPPDMYNQQGQNWSQPPWRPDELAEAGYAPLRDLVRTVLRHAGAIRVDHIMGLFRLWWIPEGAPAGAGAYVTYDHEAMVGVLALEAHLAGAMVIGEDLGTVEPWVRDYLSERGVLGTSVLWFEQVDGRPRPAEDYRELVLATVTTHDLPPTAGYLAEEHVDLRERLGLLSEPVAQVRLAARIERERMLEVLQERFLLPQHPTERQVVEALHRYVAQTPSMLVGVSLADAVGERRAQNQPGTDTEYPNWKIPLADGGEQVVLVEDLAGNARFASLVTALTHELRERA